MPVARTTIGTPASPASRAWMSRRSSRSGCELISSAVPVSSAFSTTRSRATSAPGRRVFSARGRMPDAVDVRILHGVEHPLGRLAREARVQRRDHPLARGHVLVRQVERRVRADVDLDPAQDPEGRQPLVHGVDLLRLRPELAVAEVVRMVGHREVLVAARLGGQRHLFDRLLPSFDHVVRMEVAAQIAKLDERRQLAASCCRFQLPVFSRSSGGSTGSRGGVHLLLDLRAEDLARLDGLDAVLGDGEPAPNRVLAQREVVVLRAGEVLQQVPV